MGATDGPASDTEIRVVVVDDHDLFRQGLREVLAERGIKVVGEAADGDDAVRLVAHSAPDVVVMDLSMPRMSGIEATRRISAMAPSTRVLVLTMASDDESVVEALEAGASGYVLKDSLVEDIAAGIRAAAAGHSLISPRVAARLVTRLRERERGAPRSPDVELTERELEVLRLLAEGCDNAQIAERLVISAGTVKNHVANILAKLQLDNRIQAAVYAVRRGLD
ncbi:MAG TPA: response regulator transcription factor [Solirubrobacteraceae bacterium]|nr:response regulator transcription factor [Solirubrobacteraceae bacterium]